MAFKDLSIGVSAALTIATVAPAQAQTRQFNLPEQDASTGIPAFAQQAGLQIIAPADALANVRMPAIQGAVDTQAALQRIIAATGLEIASNNGGVVVLRRPRAQGSSSTLGTPGAAAASVADSGPAVDDAGPVVDSLVDEIIVTGTRQQAGGGLLVAQRVPRARSVVTAEAISAQPPTGNIFQAAKLLPGVNTTSDDATGLFGGRLSVRGFQSDRIGWVIDGVPMNDPGSYNVFPDGWVDNENIDRIAISQGSTEADSPHVGTSGGSAAVFVSNPDQAPGLRLEQTLGDLNLYRTFVRLDTGVVRNGGPSAFISYSTTGVDKFRGRGSITRQHVDTKARYEFQNGSRVTVTGMYSVTKRDPFAQLTLADYQAFGRSQDFAVTFPGRPTPGAGPQNENAPGIGGVRPNNYFAPQRSAFERLHFAAAADIKLSERFRLALVPYYYFGSGGGGPPQFLSERDNRLDPGGQDLNGDGDVLDTLLYHGVQQTEINRPGVTAKLSYGTDQVRLYAGVWFESGRNRSTRPFGELDAFLRPKNVWGDLRDGENLVRRSDGSIVQGRDARTLNEASSIFAQGSWFLLGDRLNVVAGVRRPRLRRRFENALASDPKDAKIVEVYQGTLPNLGATYDLNLEHSFFAGLGKNYRAPQNNILFNSNRAGQKPEQSWNLDLGYRFRGDRVLASATLFAIAFKNRQLTAFVPELGISRDTNVGDVNVRGIEVEAGTKPINGFSLYVSGAYTKAEQQQDFLAAADAFLPTSGKQFPDTPKWSAAASLRYARGGLTGSVDAKYTGDRFSTLTNDERIDSFVVVDASLEYVFGGPFLVENIFARLNVSNLFDEDYLGRLPNPVTNATRFGSIAPRTPSYFVGAPRFVSVTLGARF